MEELILSFNPIIIMIGILLTGIAVYTAVDLFTNVNSMMGSKNFLFWGSSFSFSIGIWMMSFFGMLAFDTKQSIDTLLIISIITLFSSSFFSLMAFYILMKGKRNYHLIMGSFLLTISVIITYSISMYSIEGKVQYNYLLIILSFILVSSFFLFAFWLLRLIEEKTFSAVWIKMFSALIMTVSIGQGFLLIIKATYHIANSNNILSEIKLEGYWLPYIILCLSFIIFGGLILGSILTNKNVIRRSIVARDIMTAVDTSSIVFILNAKGTITYVNDKFVEISQYSQEELLGKNYDFLKADYHGAPFSENLWKHVEVGEILKDEVCHKAKDRSLFWTDMTVIPFLDDKGRPYQYIAILQDITDRKAVEKELENTMKEIQDYKYALDEASIVAITDAKGIITKVNKNFTTISKYSQEELIGSDHRLLNSGYHSKEFFKNLWKKIGNGEVWKGEIRNKAKDGSFYWVETTIIPFLNEKNKPYKYLSIRNDITEKKKQEEVLRRQEKLSALGQLAAGIAHEIRNPLTSMRGYTEFLLLDEEKEDRKEHLEIVLDEINRVNNIVEEFMMLAKPQSNILAIKNINTIIKNTVSLFSYEAKKKKVDISFTTSDDDLMVLCDENRIKQVFLNLIKNGIEAMPNGGKLSIQIERKSGFVSIKVIDSGEGIPQSILNKIGEPFFTTKESGTGLGLMISFQIIESYKGKIDIESEEGIGTSFLIDLPIGE
ncbi:MULTISPECIES: PAS domain-containing protein [Bacillus]|uniref:PAS domain-containing protein n=1 Tax=Bacillus TaxID=1386 RepID=UPI0002F5B72F|nr:MULTISPECIES: PAS domain-containing protein [Bacillus]